ncbi:hypothetical protein MNBD_DELTA01-107 [hydrothermal vent metagenome]|uniref:Cytochrome c domain-containing protein n=1 Tax=hydrothermal vent metagenome TaxID=652676 RepID=A0A3B0QQS2_9ZZZZ
MARYVVLLLTIILFVGGYGCTALPTPIPDNGSKAAGFYRARCGSCHSLPHPRRFTARQWESWLPRMERIMLERGASPMGEEEKRAIEKYLKDNAR